MRNLEKAVMLHSLDQLWKDHLANMDYLRLGINLRGYAQKQPKQEYKRESFLMFQELLSRIKHDVVLKLARVKIQAAEDVEAVDAQRRSNAPVEYQHAKAQSPAGQPPQQAAAPAPPQTVRREGQKVGRNDPCPCGSGKKYKQCHGRLS